MSSGAGLFSPTRWRDESSFKAEWTERNRALLRLFFDHNGRRRRWTFAEYGCGPNAPFRAVLPERLRAGVVCYDVHRWPHGNRIADLNDPGFAAEPADVGVVSGVLEYVEDIEASLERLARFHEHFLLSYKPLSFAAMRDEETFVEHVNDRAIRNGWKNHLDAARFTAVLGKIGYVVGVATWDKQMLFYARRHEGAA